MTTEDANQLRANADAAIECMVREHALAVNDLTEKQVVELLKQLFASGDIIRQTVVRGGTDAQCVVYIPFAREQELSGKVKAIREFCEQHLSPNCDCDECQLRRKLLEML